MHDIFDTSPNLGDLVVPETVPAPEAIVWQAPGGALKPFKSWTPSEQQKLIDIAQAILQKRRSGLAPEPPVKVLGGKPNPEPYYTAETRVTPEAAWSYYVAHVAQSVAADRRLPWSLRDFTAAELAILLDSRSMFEWEDDTKSYIISGQAGLATPGDPFRTYRFLVDNELLQHTPRDTILELLDWCRRYLQHFSSNYAIKGVPLFLPYRDAYEQWQYWGLPPIEKMIAGTPWIGHPEDGVRHRTAGCHGTTGFVRGVLRTVNIPVEDVVGGCGHACPHFVREHMYLSHGDDPYSDLARAIPLIPISELLIDQATFDAWFGANVPDTIRCRNISRRTRELAIEYLSYGLLRAYCDDIRDGKDRASGQVLALFKGVYSLQELEAKYDLWNRMDKKLKKLGGCDKLHRLDLTEFMVERKLF